MDCTEKGKKRLSRDTSDRKGRRCVREGGRESSDLASSSIHVSLHGLLALLDQRELLLLGLHGHTLTVTLACQTSVV